MALTGVQALQRWRWRGCGREAESAARDVADETPVALTYDASTYAVMMATPLDLEDFAVGFSLAEGVVATAGEIVSLELVESDLGMEARMWLSGERAESLALRRRRIAGPTGCGLCGIDSLSEAVRPPLRISADLRLTPEQVLTATASLAPAQSLNARTRAVHAAGFWRPDEGLVAAREDVGRHNALDKLIGALARRGAADRIEDRSGVVVLTSRVSVEMVQKAAVIGAPVLIAVSAPTALAVETAERAGVTLIAIAREDGFEVFTHPRRVALA